MKRGDSTCFEHARCSDRARALVGGLRGLRRLHTLLVRICVGRAVALRSTAWAAPLYAGVCSVISVRDPPWVLYWSLLALFGKAPGLLCHLCRCTSELLLNCREGEATCYVS